MATTLKVTRASVRVATAVAAFAATVVERAQDLHIQALISRLNKAWDKVDTLQLAASTMQRAAQKAEREAVVLEHAVNEEVKALGA